MGYITVENFTYTYPEQEKPALDKEFSNLAVISDLPEAVGPTMVSNNGLLLVDIKDLTTWINARSISWLARAKSL